MSISEKIPHPRQHRVASSDAQLRLLKVAVLAMIFIATIWLSYEFWRLLFQSSKMGAIDLRQRHGEVVQWFSGLKVYFEIGSAVYPPASYALLWPLLGWLSLTAARWFWALTSILVIIGMVRIALSESGVKSKWERAFVMLLPLAIYATGASIGNGQLPIHVVFSLLLSVILLRDRIHSWPQSLLIAGLFLFSLVKPTMSAPFFWIFLFAGASPRPALAIIAGYAGLSLLASAFQPDSLIQLHQDWLQNALKGVDYGTSKGGGNINLHGLLNDFGLNGWSLNVSMIMFFVLGGWTYFFRKVDVWILMGVAALVARFWTYHMWYDDMLIFIPMFAIFRMMLTEKAAGKPAIISTALFAGALGLSLAPGGLYLLPQPFDFVYVLCQKIIWHAMLFYLLYQAILSRKEPQNQIFDDAKSLEANPGHRLRAINTVEESR